MSDIAVKSQPGPMTERTVKTLLVSLARALRVAFDAKPQYLIGHQPTCDVEVLSHGRRPCSSGSA